jgi:hypothetical protein
MLERELAITEERIWSRFQLTFPLKLRLNNLILMTADPSQKEILQQLMVQKLAFVAVDGEADEFGLTFVTHTIIVF